MKSDNISFRATGQQGGSTTRPLLAKGFPVRALTGNPNSLAAQPLKETGVEVVQGDLDDRSSLDQALTGAYGLFSIQGLELGVDTEVRHGKNLADAAHAAGIQHLIYSSVGGAERNSGIPTSIANGRSKNIFVRWVYQRQSCDPYTLWKTLPGNSHRSKMAS